LNRAVFLDRDGVLNRGVLQDGRPFAPIDVSEFQLMPGVAEALVRLSAAGYLLIVVTNQPDVARGRATRSGVDSMRTSVPAGNRSRACSSRRRWITKSSWNGAS
jgi:D-glycero-D-manno-heptose 1,7-bisphosphate phosphatase